MTGARVKRVEPYLGDEELFLCTYGDGLADVDISALIDFHRSHGKLATVTSVHPPSRFGQLVVEGDEVRCFAEKPRRRRAGSTAASSSSTGASSSGCRPTPRASSSVSRSSSWPPTASCACSSTTASGSAPTRCATSSCCARLWDAGNAPWRIWDDRRPHPAEPEPHGRRAGDWRQQPSLAAAKRPLAS